MSEKIELVEISETEFMIGEIKICILDDSIIYIEVVGEHTEEIAAVVKKHYERLHTLIPGKILQLVNLNKAGKSSPESRKLFSKMIDHEHTRKIAYYGIHPVARVLASFVIGMTKSKNVRFFSNKESALVWLKKE